jgi:response regulator RpfG family c-di-GMP phosphodiesterase/serine/threonine protein kinase
MKKDSSGLGHTVELSPTADTNRVASTQKLTDRLFRQSLILTEDWEALPAESRNRILQCRDERSALDQMMNCGLLTRYQAGRIAAGNTLGLVLGSYRVLERIGAGGMAVVFKAEHMDLRHHVAIKVLPPTSQEVAGLESRFFAEMRIVARLRHPNIVAATDAGKSVSSDGNIVVRYLVMEYISGRDLDETVRQSGPMSTGRACSVGYQVASALGETHKFGIVHRDIKPSNVMLAGEDQVKLLDFGLTRHFGQRMTVPGTVLGTIDYMAPEQARDSSTVDIRADIFGLGATLYWCLTGRAPFPSDGNPVEALTRRLTAPSPSIRQVNPELPADLDAVIARMMARRPDDRYPDPEAVTQALLPFVNATDGVRANLRAVPTIEPPPPASPLDRPQRPETYRILVVDDEASVRKLCRQILHREGAIVEEAANGAQALARAGKGDIDLVLLDVAMPDFSGVEVLDLLRKKDPMGRMKVLMYSGHVTAEQMSDLLHRGADDFVTKPFSIAQLTARVQNLLRLKAAQDQAALLNQFLAAVNAGLEDRVRAQVGDEQALRNGLALAVGTVAEAREGRGAGHAIRMRKYARTLAAAAAALPAFAGQICNSFIDRLEYCAPLHDLGRAGLPDHILLKPGPLSAEERLILETHTIVASDLFRELSRADDGAQPFLQMAGDICRHHHERFDGAGYPDRLAGEAIPLAARLVAIADAYDTLRCRRVNKPALTHGAAVQLMAHNSPGRFDPAILEAFVGVASRFESIFLEEPD